MKVLHITPSTDGYEEVTLVANRINKKNHLAAIDVGGEVHMTGGFIIQDNPDNRRILDSIPNDKMYEVVKGFMMEPFVKSYLEE